MAPEVVLKPVLVPRQFAGRRARLSLGRPAFIIECGSRAESRAALLYVNAEVEPPLWARQRVRQRLSL